MKLSRSLILALALTACSATAHRVAAQDLGPIDLNDFGMSNELPVNPLPGGPLAPRVDPPSFTAPSLKGKLFKTTQRSSSNSIAPSLTQPTIEAPTLQSPTLQTPTAESSVLSPTDSTDDFVLDSGEFVQDGTVYEDQNYEGEVYEGVVESSIYEVHSVLGLGALDFRRNYGDNRLLSNNFTERGDTLSTGDVDHNQIGGFQAYLQVRSSSGTGWEFNYFGLDPSSNTAVLGNDPTSVLVGLNDVAESATGPTVADIFADGNFHALTLESSIYNFEFSFLRNRTDISFLNGRLGNIETLAGFRYIDFDESLEYATESDSGNSPRRTSFNSSVENSLYGLQAGGRSEFNLYRRLSGSLGTKFGIFYLDANANRRISGEFADGSEFSPSIINGSTNVNGYNFGDQEGDVSFLGEIDLGLIYQLGQRSRFRFGYRALGLSGLAFASDNIPDDLADVSQLRDTNDSRDLRLRGYYYTFELAF